VWQWIARIVGFVLIASVLSTSAAIGVMLIAWSFARATYVEIDTTGGDEHT